MDDTMVSRRTWCQNDDCDRYEHFVDFNEWIDGGEGIAASLALQDLRNGSLSYPSKAFYAGDREAYYQAVTHFQLEQTQVALGKDSLLELLGEEDGLHWYERNESRFNQLISRLLKNAVVPFIGAGLSVAGGFPTWAYHLRQQGVTAGLDSDTVESKLRAGDFEGIIEDIESNLQSGVDVFAHEIRDVFGGTGKLEPITFLVSEIFSDTLITTNYDSLLERAFDSGAQSSVQVLNSDSAMTVPESDKTTVLQNTC